MKKFLVAICIMTCLFSLTACGKKVESPFDDYRDEDFRASSESLIQGLSQSDDSYLQSLIDQEDGVISVAAENWLDVKGELGAYKEAKDFEVKREGKQLSAILTAQFAKREGTLTITYNEDLQPTSITVDVNYSMGERMGKAALNTLMGMGTVFVILILISLLISLFKYINKLEAKMNKKPAVQEVPVPAAPVLAEPVEELADDYELVAVISAAIAASEGTSADGFVVRSIKKRTKWQKA